MNGAPDEGTALEDRLRSLIITNSGPDLDQGPVRGTAEDGPLGKGALNARQQPFAQPPIHPSQGVAPVPTDGSLDAMPKPVRKRPNQAQRRQMSAQLSIPIEPRHQAPPTPQSARMYASPQGYSPQHFPSGGHGSQDRSQRPQSATFRSSSRGNTLPHAGREKDVLCRNMVMYGNCRNRNHGCKFSHDPDNSAPAAASFPSHHRHHSSLSYNGPASSHGSQDWRQHRHNQGEQQNDFHPQRTLFDPSSPRNPRQGNASLHNHSASFQIPPEDVKIQAQLLDRLCGTIIANAEIDTADIAEKENFRMMIEQVARSVICQHEREQNGFVDFPPNSVQLKCFGSLSSGFATKAADMDLGLLSPLSPVQPDAPNSPIPRLIEKAFLDIGLGARLLTRTRVPIIKVCEKPPNQLRQDLAEERTKWEKGVEEEVTEEAAHDEPDPAPVSTADLRRDEYRQRNHHRASSAQSPPPRSRNEKKFPSLNQGQKSLQNYFSSAKTLLRRLGGRDLASGIAREFETEEYRFINDFSREFVDGLSDDELRERLLKYRSLRKEGMWAPSELPNYRTLFGVYTQAEGEKLVMMWESRQVKEKDIQQEQQAQRLVASWQELQNKPGYGRDPLGYNKELAMAAEQLRKIPSIQLMMHSQLQHESATQYYQRTSKLMADLGGSEIPSPKNYILLPLVIRQYIQGIHSEDVRRQLGEFAQSHPGVSLRTVARRHKSLQLAYDYEKCLGKDLYPAQAVPLIQAYIKLLREPMTVSSLPGRTLDSLIIPSPYSFASQGPQLLELGDPSKMSPNQPRDPYRDRLEFPKSGVGVQCDINFSAHLALQNTLLLRCYSQCDPRVRPLVLFVKHWAKVRGINSPYRGTLSSYGYVLMMIHYLVNIAQPFVCPNLQLLAQPPDPNLSPAQVEETTTCKGRDVRFWRDEAAIQQLARDNVLNQNRDSVGHLLRGFYEYYAHPNYMSSGQGRGFDWGRDVISIRTPGGLLNKQDKGWTGAKTIIEEVTSPSAAPPPTPPSATADLSQGTAAGQEQQATSPGEQPALVQSPAVLPTPTAISTAATTTQPTREVKEVRHRYLFAIEDPFELDHNVARTVTHNGIVAIRDEFRRAWRIIRNARALGGGAAASLEDILEDATAADEMREREEFQQLLSELHGEAWEELFMAGDGRPKQQAGVVGIPA